MKDDNLGESPLPIDDAEDGTIKRKGITKDSEDKGGKTRKVPTDNNESLNLERLGVGEASGVQMLAEAAP